jgi:hypothetical protein
MSRARVTSIHETVDAKRSAGPRRLMRRADRRLCRVVDELGRGAPSIGNP